MKIVLSSIFFLLTAYSGLGQACTAPGQNPSTAFPVCGTSTFTQSSVPICGGTRVPSKTCTSTPLRDVNPFWYKFTCFQSGTLGFKITPHTNSEDYDWQLFDVTNRNPADLYNDVSMVVGSNWSGEGGETGASSTGSQLNVCDGLGRPLWSSMPTLIKDHQYLLLVSHFTQTQSGYDLSFGGGTAVITDPTLPKMRTADASCGGDIIRLKLNKRVKCSSIASNGSDFSITPAAIGVSSAVAIGCTTGFDTDSIELHLTSFLPPGNYGLNIKQGSDGNTVLDYCDQPIAAGDLVPFVVYPLLPTPMDSLAPLKCGPRTLQLVFKKPMLCSTVANDGSDFIVSGPYPVTVLSARGNCNGALTSAKEITVTLTQPLQLGGQFTIALKKGSDGNTIFDECGQETPAGSSLGFTIKDTVNADFSFQKFYGCVNDTVQFSHPGKNGVNKWDWSLADNKTSTLQNPEALYTIFNTKNVQLIVSNGFCSDTSIQQVPLSNFLKADFKSYDDNCPNEAVTFTGTAQGLGLQHSWSFGDGGTAATESPSHVYAGPNVTTPYIVQYTVKDSLGCTSSAQKTIRVYSSCYLAVPTGFTPNNDGRNDFFAPLNAVKALDLQFTVYNRWGQLVFKTNNWKQGWDGKVRGIDQQAGIYVWFLTYTDRDSKEKRQMKGTAALVR